MLDHMHVMDRKMQSMCEALKQLGVDDSSLAIPEIESCEIVSTAEELDKIHSVADEDGDHLKTT
jgi:serine O-acetyltransferase